MPSENEIPESRPPSPDADIEAREAGGHDLKRSHEELQAINAELTAANRELENKLRESEDKFRRLSDSGLVMIKYFDAAGAITDANDAFLAMIGFTREDLRAGRVSSDKFTPAEWMPRTRQALEEFKATGRIAPFEKEYLRTDGARRWAIFVGARLAGADSGVAFVLDITERKQVEAALAASQGRLDLIVDNARDFAIFSTGLDRRVTSWNVGAQAILGYTREEVLGEPADCIFTPEDRAAGAPEFEARKALTEGRAADERVHLRKDGSRFWGSGVMMAMRDARGEAIGLVKIFRDQSEVRAAQEALQAASHAKDHFLAVLSHELRTPLTPIIMALGMLSRRDDLPEAVKSAHQMIQRNVQLEAHFIDDLLDMTRMSRGKIEIVRDEMDLHEAAARAIEISSPDIEAKNQRLAVSLDAADHRVSGDFPRLQQALWNLLKNASKFTPEGGELGIRSRNEPGRVVIEIIDSGMGMEAETLGRIFNPFEQAGPTITRDFGGLGLGLAIAKATIDAHGGELRASSAGLGQGSVFTVSLPLASPATRQEPG